MRLLSFIAGYALLTSCAASMASTPPAPTNPSATQARFIEQVAATIEGKATGYVLVMRGDTTLMARGFGSPDGAIAAPTRETSFDIASISKLFTAVALLRLVDQGRVELDAPLRRYLPELPPALNDISLRHALQHDTGLPSYLAGDDQTRKSAAEALAEIGTLTRERGAGTGFHYSDIGYIAAALVIERVTGQEFRAAMRQLVFEPAQLRASGFYGDDWGAQPVAMEYAEGRATGSPATFHFTYQFVGSGEVATSVDDLHRLFRRLNEDDFLSSGARAFLLGPGIATNGRPPYRSRRITDITYSAGLFHFHDEQGRTALGHGGANMFGGHAFVYWRPADDLFVAALFNSGMETFNRGAFMDMITSGE